MVVVGGLTIGNKSTEIAVDGDEVSIVFSPDFVGGLDMNLPNNVEVRYRVLGAKEVML